MKSRMACRGKRQLTFTLERDKGLNSIKSWLLKDLTKNFLWVLIIIRIFGKIRGSSNLRGQQEKYRKQPGRGRGNRLQTPGTQGADGPTPVLLHESLGPSHLSEASLRLSSCGHTETWEQQVIPQSLPPQGDPRPRAPWIMSIVSPSLSVCPRRPCRAGRTGC